MTNKLKIWIFFLLLFFSTNFYGQDSTTIRIGPTYSNNDVKIDYFFIYDGVPLFKKSIINIVDTSAIDSIILHKTIIHDYNKKPLYNFFVEIRTKDSLNVGLKYILAETDYWIFEHPLADLILNGKKKRWNKALKKELANIDKNSIRNIEIVQQNSTRKNRYGLIKLTIEK